MVWLVNTPPSNVTISSILDAVAVLKKLSITTLLPSAYVISRS